MNKIGNFISGVKKEAERVRWPSKKDMVKYSVTTFVFIIFFAAFFTIVDFVFSFIKSMWG
jgi:preprotein translocase subunit SecE